MRCCAVLCAIAGLFACSQESAPESIAVGSGEGGEEPHLDVAILSDASAWMDRLDDGVVRVLGGEPPPEALPLDSVPEHGFHPPIRDTRVLYSLVTLNAMLSNGEMLELTLWFLPGGARLGDFEPRDPRPPPRREPFLEPVSRLARLFLGEVRDGEHQHVLTLDDVRAAVDHPQLLDDDLQRALPRTEQLDELADWLGGARVDDIDVEHIGMLVTDAEGHVLSVALQFDDDEGFRFRPGFLRVRVLPIMLGEP